MSLSEFALIERFFAPLGLVSSNHNRGVALSIGDDCALLETPVGQQLAVSIDTLVENSHFLPNTAATTVASRAFGACLSDLAAMGAEPAWMTLALTLPETDEAWLTDFASQLAELAALYRVILVGGDTTKGPVLTVTIQVHGWVPKGQALRRDQAKAGDHVFVTGTLGDSAAGLDQLQTTGNVNALVQRFNQPCPRISSGLLLRDWASAAIDISDGLLADLGHILERSQLGAEIELTRLPLSEVLTANYPLKQAQQWALAGGEDFELCFTVPAEKITAFKQVAAEHPVPITRIGQLTKNPGLYLIKGDGSRQQTTARGFQHF